MIAVLALVLAGIGVFFMLIAAIGVAIWQDTFAKLHCAGKSVTLGAACVLVATALLSGDVGVAVRCVLAALFFLLTGPIGCHALARAVWRTRRDANDRRHGMATPA